MDDQRIAEEARSEPKEPRQVSRRRFLFGSGLAVGGAVAAGIAGPVINPATAEASSALADPAADVAGEVQKAIGHVERDPQTCAGCRTCEAVCSLSHEGVVSPALARTWIVDFILEGRRIEGTVCKQCDYPECLHACPTGALMVDPGTGARIISVERCIGCQSCARACPLYPNSPIRFNPTTNKGFKCDLCGGDPRCVKFCPEGAMSLVKES